MYYETSKALPWKGSRGTPPGAPQKNPTLETGVPGVPPPAASESLIFPPHGGVASKSLSRKKNPGGGIPGVCFSNCTRDRNRESIMI